MKEDKMYKGLFSNVNLIFKDLYWNTNGPTLLIWLELLNNF